MELKVKIDLKKVGVWKLVFESYDQREVWSRVIYPPPSRANNPPGDLASEPFEMVGPETLGLVPLNPSSIRPNSNLNQLPHGSPAGSTHQHHHSGAGHNGTGDDDDEEHGNGFADVNVEGNDENVSVDGGGRPDATNNTNPNFLASGLRSSQVVAGRGTNNKNGNMASLAPGSTPRRKYAKMGLHPVTYSTMDEAMRTFRDMHPTAKLKNGGASVKYRYFRCRYGNDCKWSGKVVEEDGKFQLYYSDSHSDHPFTRRKSSTRTTLPPTTSE